MGISDWSSDVCSSDLPDSKEPIKAGEELIDFWKQMGVTAEGIAEGKLIIFSDGLDVEIQGSSPNGVDIEKIYRHFHGRVLIGFGWGTNFTNDFIGCHPADPARKLGRA